MEARLNQILTFLMAFGQIQVHNIKGNPYHKAFSLLKASST